MDLPGIEKERVPFVSQDMGSYQVGFEMGRLIKKQLDLKCGRFPTIISNRPRIWDRDTK